jgi:hypothetical protein
MTIPALFAKQDKTRRSSFRRRTLFGTREQNHRHLRERRLYLESLEDRRLLAVTITGLESWLVLGSQPMIQTSSIADPNNPSSGAIEAIAVDPNNPSRMFLGTVNGGIWRSTNADRPFNGIDDDGINGVDDPGEQPDWEPLTDTFPSLAIGDIAFDPLDPTGNTIFAGTGSTSSLGQAGGLAIGVMRTTDGGDTWSVIPINPVGGQPLVRAILPTTFDADPVTPGIQQVVLVGTVNGLFRSTDGGDTYGLISGSNGLPVGAATDVIADPNNGSRFFAGVINQGVFRSDDGGLNWTPTNNGDLTNIAGSTVVQLDAHPGGGTTVLHTLVSGPNPAAFTSNDGGNNWNPLAALPAGFTSTNFGLYTGMAADQLTIDPTDSDVVYVSKGYGGSPQVFRYDPAGAGSWIQLDSVPAVSNTRPHVDHRDLRFVGSNVLLSANDGGIYFLVDPLNPAGNRWTSLHGRGAAGLGVTEYTNVAWDSTFSVATGGSQDNGTTVQNGAGDVVWTQYRGADGADVQVDTVNAGAGQVFRYSGTQNFALQRHTFDSATNQPVGAVGLVPAGGLANFTNFFTPPFELNVVAPERLVTGGSGSSPVYELMNAAFVTDPDVDANWVAVPVGAGFGAVSGGFAYGGRLNGVDNEEVLVMGSGSGVFVRSTAGGTLTATPNAFPGGTVQDIVLDPENWQHFFVADASGVWETSDAGATWNNLTRNLAAVNNRLRSMEFVPTPGGGVIVVGGNLGVSRLAVGNPAALWTRFGQGLPNAHTFDLDYDPTDDVLLAGTFGRGAFLIEQASVVLQNATVLNICGDEDHVNQDDVFRLMRNALNPFILDVFLNSVAPVFSMAIALIDQINVFGIGGNDTLIVDSTNGLINVPGGIRYNGDGACDEDFGFGYDRGFDTLVLHQDGGPTHVSSSYLVGPGIGSGTSVIQGGGPGDVQTVFFEELEPFIDLVPAVTHTLTATPENNAINYSAGPNSGLVNLLNPAGLLTGLVTVANYEGYEFANKTELIINAGAGDDVVNLNNLLVPAGLALIIVNGGDGSDHVTTSEGVAADVQFFGGAGHDRLDASGVQPGFTALLDGGAGNDVLIGGPGNDTLVGGPGDDTLVSSSGDDNYNGGTGFNTLLVLGTPGNDRIDAHQSAANTLVLDVNGDVRNETVNNMQEVRIKAQAGNDIMRVRVADALVANPAASLRFHVLGGPPATGDRLAVIDDGLGDLVIHRQGADGRSGSITVGPLAPVIYEEVEFVQVAPLNPITGGTGSDGDGRLLVFKPDPFESNDSLPNATFLGSGAINVEAVIDPGADIPFGMPGDEDWYRIVAEVTGTLDIQVYFRQQGTLANGRAGLPGDGNLDIALYDADGLVNGVAAPIAGTGAFGTNDATDDERIRIPAVAGQTYYLRIAGAPLPAGDAQNLSAAINIYNLSVLNHAPPVPFDLELADNLTILTGAQEVPPVNTIANGTANFQYNAVANTFDLDLFVSGIELTDLTALPELTGAHIHVGPPGVNGPIIVNLGIVGWQVEPAGIRLQLAAQPFPAANIADLLAGDTYINVHSTANPGGEVRGQILVQNVLGVSDSGRSQFDNVTRDNTPTILLRLDDAILLNDLPGNAAGVPGAPPPDESIPIPFNPSTAASPVDLAPGYRVAIYDEVDMHNPVFLGFAQPVPNLNGVYSFAFVTPLSDGSHFISARVQMIDPADNDVDNSTLTRATGFGPRSQSLEIIVDTAPPPVFFGFANDPTDGLVPDPGVTPQPPLFVDNKTADRSPTFWGTAEANAIVRVYADLTPDNGVDNFDVLLGMTVALPLDGTNQYPNGQWRVSSNIDLSDPAFFPLDGLRRILVTAEDLAGNVNPGLGGQAQALEIFLDTQGPQVFGVFFPRDTQLVGVTDTGNTLLRFRASDPATILASVAVTGLVSPATETIVGIDVRPNGNLMYAVTRNTAGADRLYVLPPHTGVAEFVADITVALSGTSFGVDFDPVADRLRVVSDTDQNLSVDPVTGVAVVDAALNPGPFDVGAAAYTNSTWGTSTTGLYVIDTLADTLYLQNPAASGTLTPVGPLGVNAALLAGFDITPERNLAYAALTVAGTTQLYTIDLVTGAATLVGGIGGNPALGGLTALPPYDVFDPKPSTDGPTPLVHELSIRVQDLPSRVLPFANPAVNPQVAVHPGHFQVIGDANGHIAIQTVTFLPDPFVPGQPASGTLLLTFVDPLPDDRFTLIVSDSIVDDVGNALDGESNAAEPQENPLFPSGDGQPGGNFVARFTVDSRAEFGVWAAGSVYVDTNGNFVHDPHGKDGDFTNRDITYMFGLASDNILAGNFVLPAAPFAPPNLADGFHKLAAYGRFAGSNRWLIDTDNSGVPNLNLPDGLSIDGLPLAGRFWDGVVRNNINIDPDSDQVGVKKGTTWYLDTNANLIIDAGDAVLAGNMPGMPFAGDFDGDGIEDLGSWVDDMFYIDLSSVRTNGAVNPKSYHPNINGFWDVRFAFGFTGVRERPVAADFDGDGIDDIGLWVPDRSGATPIELAEWYLLTSGFGETLFDRTGLTFANLQLLAVPTTLNMPFTPRPFGNDIYAQFGDNFALPVVGNFDPPVVPLSGGAAGPLTDTNHVNPLDVNADGNVSALDVLMIINLINTHDHYIAQGAFNFVNGIYPDVNGDSWITALDVLTLINHLNRAGVAGEGESSDLPATLGLVDQPLTAAAGTTGAWSPTTTDLAEGATGRVADPADGFVHSEADRVVDVLFTAFGNGRRLGGDDLEDDAEDLLSDLASEVDRWWKTTV